MELSHHGFSTVNISASSTSKKCHFVVVGGGGDGSPSIQGVCDEVGYDLSPGDAAVDATHGMLLLLLRPTKQRHISVSTTASSTSLPALKLVLRAQLTR